MSKWVRSAGSKWHRVGHQGMWLNKWFRNPNWKRDPSMTWAENYRDPKNPYYLPTEELRVVAQCGTLNVKPDAKGVKIVDDLPRKSDGTLKRARICGNCVVFVEMGIET